MMKELTVEINEEFARANDLVRLDEGASIMITPPLDEDYWLFRVKLFKDQAIVGFPKFSTVGIGFAQEIDWNTNLPYTREAQQIYNHIKHNKKYEEITEEECLAAISLIRETVKKIEQENQ